MRIKYTKRLSAFLSTVIITVTLSGTPQVAQAGIPSAILMPIIAQAIGYALPRIVEREIKQLSPQERQELYAIRNDALRQLEGVLTQAQRSKIVQSLNSRQKIFTAIKSIRLTPQQRARIQSIIKSSRQRMEAILSAR
ncbi:MAG: hypothetical protein KME64_37085 [Scytonematopsis contorta HA4267-MV1]|jgi:hypothetical protein|nr:hypothetical protein [Scytonematopsis contorta HA4267-MV1]